MSDSNADHFYNPDEGHRLRHDPFKAIVAPRLIGWISSRDPDGRVAIVVADNGPGIAADQREKIFVPFFTTKRQGSGVGLTLVRQIATAHGATVDVSNTPGGGATVSMRF